MSYHKVHSFGSNQNEACEKAIDSLKTLARRQGLEARVTMVVPKKVKNPIDENHRWRAEAKGSYYKPR